MSSLIQSDRTFGKSHETLLRLLAELMIPADDGLPSAADTLIFADVCRTLSAFDTLVVQGLDALEGMSQSAHARSFAGLRPAQQMEIVQQLRTSAGNFVQTFESAVATCYYRDDRVLTSLGIPARAPFPEGYAVVPTDWSLLDPVRARQPFYREIPEQGA